MTVYSIDEYIQEKIGFIKADVEGNEMEILLGAKKAISKYEPKLSICIYHSPADFYELPMFIKKLNSNYKFKCRHHSPINGETVLYAYI